MTETNTDAPPHVSPDTLPEIPKPKNINTPVGIGGVTPTNWAEVWQIACTVSASKIYDDMSREQCALIIEAGLEHGLKTIQAFQYLKVIGDRICLWGDAPLAMVKRSSCYVQGSHKEFMTGTMEAGDWTAHCVIQRVGEEPVTRTFSMAQAKRAGLWMKRGKVYREGQEGAPTPWVTYPERMLQLRARALALRDVFPDVLLGLSIAEELEYIDVQATNETGQTVGSAAGGVAPTPTTRLDAAKGVLKSRQADAAKGDIPPWEETPSGFNAIHASVNVHAPRPEDPAPPAAKKEQDALW